MMRSRSLAPAAAMIATAFLRAPAPAAQPAPALAAGQPKPLVLSIADAMALAIRNNIQARLARAGTIGAKGRVLQAASALLPQVTAAAFQNRQYKFNLDAEGFYLIKFPGASLPAALGPYNIFDARAQITQNLFDLSAWNRTWQSEAARKAMDLDLRLAEDNVAAAAAIAYVEVLRAARDLDAARADLELAESLLKLARDKYEAGTAASIDVTRADNQRAQNKMRLIDAEVANNESAIRLKHVLGIPIATPLTLSDSLDFKTESLPAVSTAVARGLARRLEIKIADERVKADEHGVRVAQFQRLPTLTAHGDYGWSGNTPSQNVIPTGSAGINLAMPLFAGGRIFGDVLVAKQALEEEKSRLDDIFLQVEQDVRSSWDESRAAVERVSAAVTARKLSKDEVALARDRYRAGVGDNIEVITAQTSLSEAEAQELSALARYHDSRVSFAQALGAIRDFKY